MSEKIVDADVAKGRNHPQSKKSRRYTASSANMPCARTSWTATMRLSGPAPAGAGAAGYLHGGRDLLRLRADADVGDETSMIILILIYTGYRINELLQSAGTQVDLDLDVMYGGERQSRPRPSGGDPPKDPALCKYFAARATGPLLLSGYTGNLVRNNFARRDWKNTPASGDHQGRPAAPSPLHPLAHSQPEQKTAGVDNDAIKRTLGHTDFAPDLRCVHPR